MAETKSPSYSEPNYAKSDKLKSEYPWWVPNIDKHLVPDVRIFLENYCGIPPNKQSEHVHDIRDQAWAIRAYPCTGMGVFVKPYIGRSPAYAELLSKLKAGATFMDVGCHLGGDMRWLAADGAPTKNMYGIDIVSHWDAGFDMFRDKDRFQGHFIEGDISYDGNSELNDLKGKVDVISISAVLHQWLWEDQLKAAKRLVEFTSGPGAIVLGHQIGNSKAGDVATKGTDVIVWRHNRDSFARLWDQVGEETGTKWKTKARLLDWKDMGWYSEDHSWMGEEDKVLDFVVTRL